MFYMVCPFAQRLNLDLALIHEQLVRNAFASTRQDDQLHCVAPAMKFKYVTRVFHGMPFAQRLKLDLALVHDQLVRNTFSSNRQVEQLLCVAPTMKFKYAACGFHGMPFCAEIESRPGACTRPAGSQRLSINPAGQSTASRESRHENHICRL